MTLVVPDQGEIWMLRYICNMAAAGDPIIKLYTNDLTPDAVDPEIVNDEGGPDPAPTQCTFTNYIAIGLTGADWTTTQSAGITTAVYWAGGSESGITFTNINPGVSSGPIYGYYVENAAGNLLWIERFSGAPFTLPSGGGDIAIVPKITLT